MPASDARNDGPTVGLVLPGGGARGAYEAGALSVLMPALQERGERVEVFCGTSVGAINVATLAASAHLPADEQAGGLAQTWASMRKGDVIAPLIGPSSGLALLRLAGEALQLPGLRMAALLDPAPLSASLERWIDWDALHANVRGGVVQAISVIATSLRRAGPVAFVHTARPTPRSERDVRYVRVRLRGEHVRASAAIPLLFPPVEVTRPRAAAGHYIDGGTRLNAPIAPALALGADRIIVIGLEPLTSVAPARHEPGPPSLADVGANVLDGLLVDRVIEDLRRMTAINSFFVEDASGGPSPAARAYRVARGRAPYKRIAYALISPERRGALGDLAEEVFRQRYGGWRGLRSPDFLLLARLLGGGRARARGELLSFLLFDETYVAELLAAGRADARRWLKQHPGFWSTDAARADFEPSATDQVADLTALDEYRMRRRG
jgi:NTE family protein